MQKINLLIILLTLLISCRREVSIEPPPGTTTGDSGLIVKKVDEFTQPGYAGKPTFTTEYKYDSEKKLIREVFIAINGNDSTHSESLYGRDSKSRVVTIDSKSQRFINGVPYVSPEGVGSDTITTTVIYLDAISGKINYIKATGHSGEKVFTDSTAYEYDNNDHVMKTTSYYLPTVQRPGDTLVLSGYSSWVFNEKGSLLQLEQGGTDTLGLIRYRYEYDNKINPLFKKEDVFLGQWEDYSPNNVVKQNVFIPATGENYDNTAVYQYRSDDKPSSASYYSPVVNGTSTTTYYYK
jgi:hypothetical protein